MIYCFTDKILKIAYDIAIANHHDKHAKSQLTIASEFANTGIDINHFNKIMVEMGHVYAKVLNQKIFKNQLTFGALFINYG